MSFKSRGFAGFCRREHEGEREAEDNTRRFERDNEQEHVHELLGSVQINERKTPHNHRFATVTGEAIRERKDYDGESDFDYHVHEVEFRTDNFEDHFHEFRGRTGGPIMAGDRHIHFLEDVTSIDDGHDHDFRAATLIENPIGDDRKKKKKKKKRPWDDCW
ncbi:MAG: YmaF family protein [Firmicutes bacterium ADurb.Bin182]|nr:MAG: YmaF family protein [Firmicutes bacterium ADurb.Bin182]